MNLNSSIDFDIKNFFHWWGRELTVWLPEKLRQVLIEKTDAVYLSATADEVRLYRMVDGRQQALGGVSLDEKGAESYQQMLAENPELEKAQFILRLNSAQGIAKVLSLPVAAKENLQQVVTFEIDRYTPFKAEQLYFSVKQTGHQGNGHLSVLLVLTPRKTLDTIFQGLIDIGIHPSVADYEGAPNDPDDFTPAYNLLPQSKRPIKNKITQLMTNLLTVMVFVLIFVVLVFPVWHGSRTVDSLRERLTQLEKEAFIIQSRQREIDDIVDETERLIQAKNSAPSVTELINTLTKLLPDTTWLTHLQFRNKRLQIQGQSPSASALIGVLEGSPLFSNARFVSPLTQDKRTGLERFQISVDVDSPGADDA